MIISLPLDQPNLSPVFFDDDPSRVARQLLGCALARYDKEQWVGGYIVETEAYLSSGDSASHSAKGETPRCASMFCGPGVVYVYSIHNRFCLNFVTQPEGVGSAVLIRALEPVWGIDRMKQCRQTGDLRRLTSGPGMICQALGIDRSVDGTLPLHSAGWMMTSAIRLQNDQVAVTRRVGITRSADLLLRFFVAGNRFVSGRAVDHGRPRVESIATKIGSGGNAVFELASPIEG